MGEEQVSDIPSDPSEYREWLETLRVQFISAEAELEREFFTVSPERAQNGPIVHFYVNDLPYPFSLGTPVYNTPEINPYVAVRAVQWSSLADILKDPPLGYLVTILTVRSFSSVVTLTADTSTSLATRTSASRRNFMNLGLRCLI